MIKFKIGKRYIIMLNLLAAESLIIKIKLNSARLASIYDNDNKSPS